MKSLALLTDLYQLTMAYGYWKTGMAEQEGVFHLFFRKPPFGGNFAIAAGLERAVEFIETFRFDSEDLAYLATLKGTGGKPLFEPSFLDYLRTFKFTCSLDGVEEGTPVCPYEPILRVEGPLIQAQLLESPLLNIINFQTLIATKAARLVYAARPDPIIEFGMRRAQGIDGALSASRAAFIGGCSATSHVLAGKEYGIPVKGTQAHSWVMAFDEETEAFRAFGRVQPHNSLFLVDTYDTLEGTRRAVRVILEMQERGEKVLGVRLDSGDLAPLSRQVRTLLDEAGLYEVAIMASNELDEYTIARLKQEGCVVTVWGVGTHLVTAKEQPALDGVYKLAALRPPGKEWEPKLKLSESPAKMTDPGILQVRRFTGEKGHCLDVIYDTLHPPLDWSAADPSWAASDLLIPIVRQGKRVCDLPPLEHIRSKSLREQALFPDAMRALQAPASYPVVYEKGLLARKEELARRLKQREEAP